MKVSFPNMGNSWPAFKTFFECMGAEVILPDPTNRNDVKIGVKHSPEIEAFVEMARRKKKKLAMDSKRKEIIKT